MRVEVKFHRDCEPEYLAWMARNAEPPGSREVAKLFESELIEEFRRKEGVPDGATARPQAVPPYFVWRFNADTWVRYELFRVPGRIWGASLKVVIRRISRTPLP